jgi:hypothetical protein
VHLGLGCETLERLHQRLVICIHQLWRLPLQMMSARLGPGPRRLTTAAETQPL